jgi:hypothetical protein
MTHALGAVPTEEIEPADPLDYVVIDDEQQSRIRRVRNAAKKYRQALLNTVPSGKPLGKALNRLQESQMWANWGISRDRRRLVERVYTCLDSKCAQTISRHMLDNANPKPPVCPGCSGPMGAARATHRGSTATWKRMHSFNVYLFKFACHTCKSEVTKGARRVGDIPSSECPNCYATMELLGQLDESYNVIPKPGAAT